MTPYFRKSRSAMPYATNLVFWKYWQIHSEHIKLYFQPYWQPQELLKALTQTNLDMNKQLEQTSHFVHSGPISDILCNCGFVSFPIKKQLLFWQWSAFCFSLIYTSISLHIIYAIAWLWLWNIDFGFY